jgi:hypothetical protein
MQICKKQIHLVALLQYEGWPGDSVILQGAQGNKTHAKSNDSFTTTLQEKMYFCNISN